MFLKNPIRRKACLTDPCDTTKVSAPIEITEKCVHDFVGDHLFIFFGFPLLTRTKVLSMMKTLEKTGICKLEK